MGKTHQVIISGTIIGLILALSQPIYSLGILVFLGFGLFFLAVKIIKEKHHLFWFGYLIGLLYFLFYFKWFLATDYPLLFTLFAWILTAGALALLWGINAQLCKKLDSKISWPALLIFPSVFTFFEFLRSYLIGVFWVGRQTLIGPNWTNGNLAYNLHQSFLALKISSWFGIYGVTFLIIFLSVLLFLFLEKRRYKKLLFLVLGIFILFYWPSPKSYLPAGRQVQHARLSLAEGGGPCNVPCVEISTLQTKVPTKNSYTPAEEASFFKSQLELMDSISKDHPQTKLIVFPEESNFFKNITLFKNTLGVSQYFADLFDSSVQIIDNSQISENDHFQSKTIFLDSKKGILGSYEKRLITPGAEYLPLIFTGLDKILGLNSSTVRGIKEYKPGEKLPTALQGLALHVDNFRVTSLICADNLSPNLARQAAFSNLLVSQSSFGFAKGAEDLLAQDLAVSKFRAAENSRYLIKSSNFGRSFIISDQGKLEKITPNLDWQILTGSVVLKENKTLYNRVGDAPILWASFAVLIASIFWRRL